ncbi:hypothetical protein B0T10DRAFT_131530 [Thelonectria olida]|uniref:Inner kinetochore subunit AME1 domain-containing protein n=1 Tax=Thelonectria olida TaxID=1576542 RepID=A0A9P8VXY2_9HYPO|nr:hypothetical protein B0T10DRAFT_131530 [Thelonectria olida]
MAATGQQARRDRLNERLRGAQRTNLEDDSFQLDIAGLNIATSDPSQPPPSSARRSTPNTSAKRRRLSRDEVPPPRLSTGSAPRRWSPPADKDPYGLPETSKESIEPAVVEEREQVEENEENVDADERDEERQDNDERGEEQRPTIPVITTSPPEEPAELEQEDALESLPVQLPPRPSVARRLSRQTDEIAESPQDAPGTGARRSLLMSDVPSSTTRLHGGLDSDNIEPPSSPSVRRARRSSVAASTRSMRSSRRSPRISQGDDVDELSPVQPRDESAADADVSALQPIEEGEEEAREEAPVDVIEEPMADDEAEATEEEAVAEEINEVEAAKTLGRKRPRRSPRRHSPELGSGGHEEVEEVNEEEPAPKRRRGRQAIKSPAKQKQPATKPKAKPTTRKSLLKSAATRGPKTKTSPKVRRESNRRQSADDNGASIEVTVQRFVNVKKHSQSDDEDDPLHSEIPFSTHRETVVDVFAQVCKEVIDSTLNQLREVGGNTEDRTKKKEFRIKMRAIEAYGEELNSRLLQHAIHLNDWHSLRKRVRLAQREKVGLREEILRLKGEQEQVALRMDAVRIKHEEDTKESKYRLDTSSVMHDVDLAIERGRDAPELSRAEQKQAELANLELLVSRISGEASSNSAAGGMLKQVKDFNAFLERAAIALETR